MSSHSYRIYRSICRRRSRFRKKHRIRWPWYAVTQLPVKHTITNYSTVRFLPIKFPHVFINTSLHNKKLGPRNAQEHLVLAVTVITVDSENAKRTWSAVHTNWFHYLCLYLCAFLLTNCLLFLATVVIEGTTIYPDNTGTLHTMHAETETETETKRRVTGETNGVNWRSTSTSDFQWPPAVIVSGI